MFFFFFAIFFFSPTVEIMTNLMIKEMKLKQNNNNNKKNKTEEVKISQDIFTRSSKLHWFTGQQTGARALDSPISPSCILYG